MQDDVTQNPETMDDLGKRIAALSPAKRALLELRLQKQSLASPAIQTIPRRTIQEAIPLSFAQQRLWFLDQFEPNSPLYNITKALRIRGDLHSEALQKTLDAIIARHEALRTIFVATDGIPQQVIRAPQPVSLQVIDLRTWPMATREAEAHRLLQQEAHRPFDLTQDLMLRATLLHLEEKEYILLLVMHHIASDGWSMSILFREFSILYAAFASGQPSPLPELPLQYADFAIWQREWLQGEVLEEQLAYWKQQLAEAPPLLELPTDHPRPPVQHFRGAHHSFQIPKSLMEALKRVSQQERVTLFMTLLAAFQTLLYRYSRQEDILIGSPIAGRNRPEIEGLIGFFVNTLVLRTRFSDALTFRELLTQVREVCLGAYAHQELPFEKLVEELQPERSLSYTPLFQVLFVLQNTPRSTLTLPGITMSPLDIEGETTKFDLTLSLTEEKEGLKGWLRYNTDLFGLATIQRMVGHFQRLLEGIVANPDQPISLLPLLTDPERHQLLVEWNNTQMDYPKESCLHHLFEAQVEQTPDAVAVICEEQQLTYHELNKRANKLAHYLQKQGVGPEVLVGICMERSVEMIIGLLGILKAGGAYVPLDPTYPQERLAFILQDTQVPVLLTQHQLCERLPEHQAQMLCLNTEHMVISPESEENPVSAVTAHNAAYVLYTSGTTGHPKGAVIEHRSLVNYLCWIMKYLLGDKIQSLPLVTKLIFDASLKQLWAPLICGRAVWVLPETMETQPVALLQTLSQQPNSGINCVPALWQVLLDAMEDDQTLMPATKNLSSVLLGGEQFSKELVERSFTLLPHLQIWNMYGPTETTANSSVAHIVTADEITIGRPLANTHFYIVDQNLQPLPVGVPGELCIGGDGLSRGYLHRPELTAEKFIPNPFSEKPGARLYRTGDLVRYRPDGNLEFLGRIDDQVKIRGFRIELKEIEAVLRQHPAVRDTVVLLREEVRGDKRLVAYIVLQEDTTSPINELRNFLQQKLPAYMLPSSFVFLDALPLTPTGKVDRRALPAPHHLESALEPDFVAPRTPMEIQIAEIWQKVLGVDRIGVYDNFFDLGGHSLLSMQVVARLEKQVGIRINPQEMILQNLGQLAAICEGQLSLLSKSSPKSFTQTIWETLKRYSLSVKRHV